MKSITLTVMLVLGFCLQGCALIGAPYFEQIRVEANRSSSGRAFVADCGEEIKIKWKIANERNIGSQHIKFLYTTLTPDGLFRVEQIDLSPDIREHSFTFNGPVTAQLIVRRNNDEQTPHTVMLDFIAKDYYFNAILERGENLREYPQLGNIGQSEITLDFVGFTAFYDTGEAGTIDYVKSLGGLPAGTPPQEGPFRARTRIPAEEHEATGDNDEIVRSFEMDTGYLYPYNEVNAVVFGGAFAKFGEKIIVTANKEEEVEVRQSTTEKIEPIFLEVTLSDYGEWLARGTSNPSIVDVQLGNLMQRLVLHNYNNILPGPVADTTTIGSVTTATVQRQSNQRGTIEGSLKGAVVGMLISTSDGEWIAAPVSVGIKEAEWRMPYLRDIDNLESTCGE